MASPPNAAGSPSGMSPPGPTPASLPNKKRSSTLEVGAPNKRRKASNNSAAPTHPLRQTSFPPPESNSPFPRSPSVDATSHVSGSAVSTGRTVEGKPKKKRGRKPKNAQGLAAADGGGGDDGGREKTPSLLGGRAPTNTSGQGGGGGFGDKEDEDEPDAEMAVEDAETPTKEQEQEELRMRAMLYQALDPKQKSQYEVWRGSSIKEANVKRVVNATVSQSVQGQISSSVRAVTKVFAGELIELARQVQTEFVRAGEKQTDLPTPPPGTAEAEAAARDESERRGPLRPEHLREAWRRYQRCGEGRGVGTQQPWHAQQGDGVDRFSTKTGKRMFR